MESNPYAFPICEDEMRGGDIYTTCTAPGMTLRDYFAGQALPALITRYTQDADATKFAKAAYRIADDMLEMRKDGDQ